MMAVRRRRLVNGEAEPSPQRERSSARPANINGEEVDVRQREDLRNMYIQRQSSLPVGPAAREADVLDCGTPDSCARHSAPLSFG